MLYDPGPITLLTAGDFPVAGPRSNFAGIAAEGTVSFDAQASVLIGAQLTMGSDLNNNGLSSGALDLAAAEAEMDSQSRASDPSIGDVAGSALTLEGDLTGLTNDLAPQLGIQIPDETPYPESAWNPDDGEFNPRRAILGWYVDLLGRQATSDEVIFAEAYPGGLQAFYLWLIATPEYLARHGGGAAPPRSTPYHSIEYWEALGVPNSDIFDANTGQLMPGWARTADGYDRVAVSSSPASSRQAPPAASGPVTNAAFEQAYRNILGRAPQSDEWPDVARWTQLFPGQDWLPMYIDQQIKPRVNN